MVLKNRLLKMCRRLTRQVTNASKNTKNSTSKNPVEIVRLHWLERVGLLGSFGGIAIAAYALLYQINYNSNIQRPINQEESIIRAWSLISMEQRGNIGKASAINHIYNQSLPMSFLSLPCDLSETNDTLDRFGRCERPEILDGLRLTYREGLSSNPLSFSNFTGASITNSIITNLHIEEINLYAATIENLNTNDVIISNSDFSGAQFQNSTLSNSIIFNNHFDSTYIENSRIENTIISMDIDEVHLSYSDLRFNNTSFANSVLEFIDLTRSFFRTSEFENTIFRFTNISGARFNRSIISPNSTGLDLSQAYANPSNPPLFSGVPPDQVPEFILCDNAPFFLSGRTERSLQRIREVRLYRQQMYIENALRPTIISIDSTDGYCELNFERPARIPGFR